LEPDPTEAERPVTSLTPRVPHSSDAACWTREAEHFDRIASEVAARLKPVSSFTLNRYGKLKRRRFSLEFRFRLIGDPRGLRVLDVGCGDGLNAAIMAKLGALVTGVDVSPGAIEVAERRAALNGVSDRARFMCAPLETVDFPARSFDVVWGDAILHHMLGGIDDVLPQLAAWCKPGGLVVFSEPIVLSPITRYARRLFPANPGVTEDERQLEAADLARIAQHLPGLAIRHYNLIGRANRFLRRPAVSKVVSPWIAALDYALLSLPGVRRLAGTCVLWWRAPGA